MRIVDSHCHLESLAEADARLRRMDELGIAKAVVCAGKAAIAYHNARGNRMLARAVRGHADRLVGLASVNPWSGRKGLGELARALDDGLGGLKVHSHLQGFRLSDEIVDPFIELCRERGCPVYCHTGTPITAEPFQLTCLARRHPKVSFIEGHLGWSDFWYDGVEAARLAPNVWVETSHMLGGLIEAAVRVLGAGRVLFGSNAPISHARVELRKIQRLHVSDRHKRAILGENALRLFWP